ncbi:hypothetical protein ABZ733_07010 [Streptomyces longwoodensis]|uniref:hypothetical protein n=1 Tax=Streptomyces longwoodensis TaxID=68231 RepID=UPI0033CD85EE
MRTPTRHPLYPKPWHRWAWAALPAISATALTFVPFLLAWQRRVVGWRTLAVYLLVSGVTIGAAIAKVDIHQWGEFWREVIRYVGWAYLIIGVVHVALLDWPHRTQETVKQ